MLVSCQKSHICVVLRIGFQRKEPIESGNEAVLDAYICELFHLLTRSIYLCLSVSDRMYGSTKATEKAYQMIRMFVHVRPRRRHPTGYARASLGRSLQ